MRVIFLTFYILLLLLPWTTSAQELISSPAETQRPLTEATVTEFLDQWSTNARQNHDLPGLAIVLVRDNETLYLKSHGVANRSSGEPLTPDHLLQAGSIAELITATTILHEVRNGRLSLTADIAPAVPTSLIQRYRGPFNLHQLLTHTSGTGHSIVANYTRVIPRLENLEEYLLENLRQAPDYLSHNIVYSNDGIALAGLIAESRAGLPFHLLAKESVLSPLGMKDSGYTVNGGELSPLGYGHHRSLGRLKPSPISNVRSYPAENFITTLEDMATFINFQLGYAEDNVLRKSDLLLMQTSREPQTDLDVGIAYGFRVTSRNGHVINWIADARRSHSNLLLLIPSEQLGVYVHTNRNVDISREFIKDFMDHFFPYKGKSFNSSSYLPKLAGSYRLKLHSGIKQSKPLQFITATEVQKNVRWTGDHYDIHGALYHYRHLDDYLVNMENGSTLYMFRDKAGNIDAIYDGGTRFYSRIHWYERKGVQAIAFVFLLIASAVITILSAMSIFQADHFGKFGITNIFLSASFALLFLLVHVVAFLFPPIHHFWSYPLIAYSSWVFPYMVFIFGALSLLGFIYDFSRNLLTRKRAILGIVWLCLLPAYHFFYKYWELYGS